MRRRLFAVVSAVSLLLCLASVGLWVRSTDRHELVVVTQTHSAVLQAQSYHGGVRVRWVSGPAGLVVPDLRLYSRRAVVLDQQGYISIKGYGGFAYAAGDVGSGVPHPFHELRFPYWVAVAVLAALPLYGAYCLVRFGRGRLSGGCVRCGYSLTGNTSGVCPECGTPVPKEPADKSPRPA